MPNRRHRLGLRKYVGQLVSGWDPLNRNGSSLFQVTSDQQIDERLPFARRTAGLMQVSVQALRVRHKDARDAGPMPLAFRAARPAVQQRFQQQSGAKLSVQSSGQ